MFQPLRVERHADPIVPDNLDQPASGSSKNVQIASMRVPAERLLDLQRQAVHALAHVRAADRQPHPNARGNRDHRRSSTSSTSRSADALDLLRKSGEFPVSNEELNDTATTVYEGICGRSGPPGANQRANAAGDRR